MKGTSLPLPKELQELVLLAREGHHPLFHPSWLFEAAQNEGKEIQELTHKEITKLKIILERLARHTTLERKKTVLLAMNIEDRKLLVTSVLNYAENDIRNEERFH